MAYDEQLAGTNERRGPLRGTKSSPIARAEPRLRVQFADLRPGCAATVRMHDDSGRPRGATESHC